MNNITTIINISPTINFFHRYLLGESLKNILIRLTVILSSIIIVWCGIMLALIIHMKCQHTKQILKSSNTHHHLYDSNSSLNRKRSIRSKNNRRLNSSSSTCCYSIGHILLQLKECCIFWPSSSSTTTTINEISFNQQIETIPMNTNLNQIPFIIQSMNKQPLDSTNNIINIKKKFSLYHEIESLNGDELKNIYPITKLSNNNIKKIHYPSISFPINENENNYHTTKIHLQNLNAKTNAFFNPITRRISNINTNSYLPPINIIQNQQQNKPLLMISSAKELTSNNEWKWHHSLIDDLTTTDGSITSSSRHIPLVMITDTSSSNTNIIELETYEDKHRLVGDIERRLSQELRASYRPRHST